MNQRNAFYDNLLWAFISAIWLEVYFLSSEVRNGILGRIIFNRLEEMTFSFSYHSHSQLAYMPHPFSRFRGSRPWLAYAEILDEGLFIIKNVKKPDRVEPLKKSFLKSQTIHDVIVWTLSFFLVTMGPSF